MPRSAPRSACPNGRSRSTSARCSRSSDSPRNRESHRRVKAVLLYLAEDESPRGASPTAGAGARTLGSPACQCHDDEVQTEEAVIEGTATVGVLIVDDQAPFRDVARTVVRAVSRLRRRGRGRVGRGGGRGRRSSGTPSSCSWTSTCPASTASRRPAGSLDDQPGHDRDPAVDLHARRPPRGCPYLRRGQVRAQGGLQPRGAPRDVGRERPGGRQYAPG